MRLHHALLMAEYFDNPRYKELLEKINKTCASWEYAKNETYRLLKKYNILNEDRYSFYEKTLISEATFYRILQGDRLSKRTILIICLAFHFEYEDALVFLALHERCLDFALPGDRVINALLQRAGKELDIDFVWFANEYLKQCNLMKLTK